MFWPILPSSLCINPTQRSVTIHRLLRQPIPDCGTGEFYDHHHQTTHVKPMRHLDSWHRLLLLNHRLQPRYQTNCQRHPWSHPHRAPRANSPNARTAPHSMQSKSWPSELIRNPTTILLNAESVHFIQHGHSSYKSPRTVISQALNHSTELLQSEINLTIDIKACSATPPPHASACPSIDSSSDTIQ